MIRHATLDDLPDIVVMGRQFFDVSGFAEFAEWDSASFQITATALINGTINGGLLVVEDGSIIGMAGCIIFPLFCNHAKQVGQEVFWWVAPEKRSGIGATLLRELEADARRKGADIFLSGQIAGQRDAAFARVYARRGYRPAETSYIKGLAS